MKHHHCIGREIGEFSVQAYVCGKIKTITKEDMIGKWSLFFFYPADFTFVCPTELKDLAEHYEEFNQEGCEVYSVSTDSEFVHKAWADASETIRSIQYPMLADTAWKLSKEFGVLVKEAGQALRAAFIVSPEGKIKAYEVHDMGIGRNAKELLRVLRAAKFVEEHGDQVCPAKWEPGEETLMPSLDLVGRL
ncbi:MAG: peroxiredoxin [Lachnospiraceae bacterium]|nr:peroxiredoxin [Lachnospiraceae bacterium]